MSGESNLEFPKVSEESIRSARLRTFAISVTIASLPFAINIFWRIFDTRNENSAYVDTLPDLCFIGIGVCISSFSNTIVSFVKLDGWSRITTWTFISLFCVATLAVFSFVSYLMSSHNIVTGDAKETLFITSILFTVAIFVSGIISQYCFLSDECQASRLELLRISENNDGR